jgi:hypothetical protein
MNDNSIVCQYLRVINLHTYKGHETWATRHVSVEDYAHKSTTLVDLTVSSMAHDVVPKSHMLVVNVIYCRSLSFTQGKFPRVVCSCKGS